MDEFFQGLGAALAGAAADFERFTNGLLAGLSGLQVGLVVLAMLIAIVVLIIALIVRSHKYNTAMDLIDQQADDAQAAKRAADDAAQRLQMDQEQQRARLMAEIDERDKTVSAALSEREAILAKNEEELRRLREFHDKHQTVESLKSEALAYAAELKIRADREYAQIIEHAQAEAKTIREISEGMMTRSQQMLRQTLMRSSEIADAAPQGTPSGSADAPVVAGSSDAEPAAPDDKTARTSP